MAHHGGNGFGWTSHQTVVKDQDLAIVILTNQDHSVFTYAMTYSIIDKLLAVEDVDWVERYLTLKKKQDEQKAKQTVAHLSGKIDNTPCRELEAVSYTHLGVACGILQLAVSGSRCGWSECRRTTCAPCA